MDFHLGSDPNVPHLRCVGTSHPCDQGGENRFETASCHSADTPGVPCRTKVHPPLEIRLFLDVRFLKRFVETFQ